MTLNPVCKGSTQACVLPCFCMFIILTELASCILTPEADECGKMMLNGE